MNPASAISTILIATFLAALSFASPASAYPSRQINLAIDDPTPKVTATAQMDAGCLALQGETVTQARSSAA